MIRKWKCGSEEQGLLEISGPEFVQVQIDGKQWQYISAKPISLTAGEHKLVTLAGKHKVEIRVNTTTMVAVKASSAEQGAHDGIALFNQRQLNKALRLLERAYSTCERTSGKSGKVCVPLMAEISYYMGSILEAQDRLDTAATEYQHVIDSEAHGAQVASYRDTAKRSLDKLASRLGLIVFKQSAAAGCQEEKLWVQPGNPVVTLGGQERTVYASGRARQSTWESVSEPGAPWDDRGDHTLHAWRADRPSDRA